MKLLGGGGDKPLLVEYKEFLLCLKTISHILLTLSLPLHIPLCRSPNNKFFWLYILSKIRGHQLELN